MSGKAYEVVTSSIQETLSNLRAAYEEDEAITFEDAISELISTLETKMREKGMKTSQLWEDCGF